MHSVCIKENNLKEGSTAILPTNIVALVAQKKTIKLGKNMDEILKKNILQDYSVLIVPNQDTPSQIMKHYQIVHLDETS